MRSVIATVAVAIVLIILVGGVFIYSGAYYVGADQPHWSATSWLLDQARIRSIRFHASGIALPAGLGTEQKIVAGVGHFADHCVICHGAPGVPQGDLAQGLYPRPPSLRTAAGFYMPAELFWIIMHGIKMSGMPHPADPIKCHIEHVENADIPTGVHIAHHEPLPLDPLENGIGQNRPKLFQGAERPLRGRQRSWNVGPKRQNWGPLVCARVRLSVFRDAGLRYLRIYQQWHCLFEYISFPNTTRVKLRIESKRGRDVRSDTG